MMKKIIVFIVIVFTSSAFSQEGALLDDLDLPLMEGLVENREAALLFDSPDGRIINAEASGALKANEVNNFEEDKQFIINIFTDIIVPNDKFYEFLEDNNLTWIDDIPVVNTHIVKQLNSIKSIKDTSFTVPKIFKDLEDKEFVSDLFKKTVLNEVEFAKEFVDKTPNWDSERIAELDTIVLKMAICEFLKFPSIPVKVTINEYLEIAKEYSTPKSSIFINGILDVLANELTSEGVIKKSGRGLIDNK